MTDPTATPETSAADRLEQGVEELARDSKLALARRLVARCASMLDGGRIHAG